MAGSNRGFLSVGSGRTDKSFIAEVKKSKLWGGVRKFRQTLITGGFLGWLLLTKFYQDTARCFRMQKANQFIVCPQNGRLLQECEARRRQAGHFGTNIIDRESQMVQTRPPFFQKPGDGAVGLRRGNKFQLGIGRRRRKEAGGYSLRGNRFPFISCSPQEASHQLVGFVKFRDGNPDVIEAHGFCFFLTLVRAFRI